MTRQETKKDIKTVSRIRGILVTVAIILILMPAGCRGISQQTDSQEHILLNNSTQNFIRVPLSRQATDYTCGVAAMQSVLYYYGEEYREDTLAEMLKSDPENGTNYRNMVKLAQSSGLQAEVRSGMTINELKSLIRSKKLVIVALQAWADNASNYANDWDDGHYAIAIGYDSNRIYFMDPSTLGNYTFITNSEFLKRWHDIDSDNITRLEDFGIVVWKDKPSYNPNVILPME